MYFVLVQQLQETFRIENSKEEKEMRLFVESVDLSMQKHVLLKHSTAIF